nr:MAG TPA: TIP39 peptide [Caudoviricetes sp.]
MQVQYKQKAEAFLYYPASPDQRWLNSIMHQLNINSCLVSRPLQSGTE